MRRLPPLSAVEAFVHTARLGSVKAAAAELSLSSPALSRRIQALERFVGYPLFDRLHQGIALNVDGEQFLGRIAPALDMINDAVENATGQSDILRLRLAVLPLFATQKLMPRLSDLRAKCPHLHLDIDTGAHSLLRLGEGIDAAITLVQDVDAAYYSRKIAQSWIQPVASKSLFGGREGSVPPEEIANVTVFIHRDMADLFHRWCEVMGIGHIEPVAIDHFDSGQLMLEAAAQGLGVAFLLREHFEAASDPRLIVPFDKAIASPYNYYFACRRNALSNRAVRMFHDWLFSDQPGEISG